ncbi:uncharacterized protein THITE_2125099 [Thermothielavioides terrestris NRRL 8126]|uniref:Uncharacterized protein n=1 Tax=Thermothielavioides terrestris (strain ATCC 38088 / NRRL 8126) TaxID=578455 RepID=G2QQM0_THETT|nr:uncharacterized protein THITE_2125099 [Thermothielavioides terrestris NRRL 8126]AEO62430.1 hypothetical protein THITE_2125099 [Thermothielavioides terrestris NRRL 8126]
MSQSTVHSSLPTLPNVALFGNAVQGKRAKTHDPSLARSQMEMAEYKSKRPAAQHPTGGKSKQPQEHDESCQWLPATLTSSHGPCVPPLSMAAIHTKRSWRHPASVVCWNGWRNWDFSAATNSVCAWEQQPAWTDRTTPRSMGISAQRRLTPGASSRSVYTENATVGAAMGSSARTNSTAPPNSRRDALLLGKSMQVACMSLSKWFSGAAGQLVVMTGILVSIDVTPRGPHPGVPNLIEDGSPVLGNGSGLRYPGPHFQTAGPSSASASDAGHKYGGWLTASPLGSGLPSACAMVNSPNYTLHLPAGVMSTLSKRKMDWTLHNGVLPAAAVRCNLRTLAHTERCVCSAARRFWASSLLFSPWATRCRQA